MRALLTALDAVCGSWATLDRYRSVLDSLLEKSDPAVPINGFSGSKCIVNTPAAELVDD